MSSFKKDTNQKHKSESVTDGLNILSFLLQMLACPANYPAPYKPTIASKAKQLFVRSLLHINLWSSDLTHT